MKNLLAILLLGGLNLSLYAQNTNVTFGRYGDCNSGRGICGIQFNEASRATNNADIVWENDQLILRIYKEKITTQQQSKIVTSINELDQTTLKIEANFNLNKETANYIAGLTGFVFNTIDELPYPIYYTDQFIELHLNPRLP